MRARKEKGEKETQFSQWDIFYAAISPRLSIQVLHGGMGHINIVHSPYIFFKMFLKTAGIVCSLKPRVQKLQSAQDFFFDKVLKFLWKKRRKEKSFISRKRISGTNLSGVRTEKDRLYGRK